MLESNPREFVKKSKSDTILILVVAGDPSGDLHAASLIRELKALNPGLRAAAVGGPRLKESADEFLEDLASRGMTGFWEPVKALPFFAALRARLRAFMAERRPAALVCVDYYGFNRRVLSAAQAENIPAYYFISPQVWASRPGRVQVLKGLIRRMLAIFPFEEPLYRKAGVPCAFVGHPLLDLIAPPGPRRAADALRLGLLPGSRRSELSRHLPVFLEAAELLRRHFPRLELLVFGSPSLPDSAYAQALSCGARLVRESDYRERGTLDLALCSSGTATLENALLGLPMVVIYKMSWPSYAVARSLVSVSHIAMANILAGKTLVPELIQKDATAEKVARAAVTLLENPRRLAALRAELSGLRAKLGTPGAARRAAAEILADLPAAAPGAR